MQYVQRLSTVQRTLCGFLLLALLGAPGFGDDAAPIKYGRGKELAKLEDKEIRESSGVAASRIDAGILWTHNDSGDGPRLFAFDKEGKARATITLKGIRARDWEDMASVTIDKQSILLIADVGDNAKRREHYVLHAIKEPALYGKGKVTKDIGVWKTIRFTYKDGVHNCESLGIDPTDKTIYLVSKIAGLNCKVYALSWPEDNNATIHAAKPIADIQVPVATAMDISPDGLRAVVGTYSDAYVYTRKTNETWAQGFAKKPRRVRLPKRQQGESICYGHDGKTLYLTSECKRRDPKSQSPLIEIPVVEKK